jgi:hypothetical protein
VPGIYTVTPIDVEEAAASAGGATPSSGPTPAGPSPVGGALASPGATPAADDPLAPVRFAVDLFDVDESTIAPGSAATIEALGTSGPGPGEVEPTERPTTRDELWIPIVLIVLAVLGVEWALYHRDALVRIRRALAGRLSRGATHGAG